MLNYSLTDVNLSYVGHLLEAYRMCIDWSVIWLHIIFSYNQEVFS